MIVQKAAPDNPMQQTSRLRQALAGLVKAEHDAQALERSGAHEADFDELSWENAVIVVDC